MRPSIRLFPPPDLRLRLDSSLRRSSNRPSPLSPHTPRPLGADNGGFFFDERVPMDYTPEFIATAHKSLGEQEAKRTKKLIRGLLAYMQCSGRDGDSGGGAFCSGSTTSTCLRGLPAQTQA